MTPKSRNGDCSRLVLSGPKGGNPFVDVTLEVDFALGARTRPRARLL